MCRKYFISKAANLTFSSWAADREPVCADHCIRGCPGYALCLYPEAAGDGPPEGILGATGQSPGFPKVLLPTTAVGPPALSSRHTPVTAAPRLRHRVSSHTLWAWYWGWGISVSPEPTSDNSFVKNHLL